jgi:lactoylglutathione lyase
MGIAFTSITVNTANLENMLRFYEILGCAFTAVKVDKGGKLYRSLLDGFELNLLSVPVAEKISHPKIMMSFRLSDLDKKLNDVRNVPGVFTMLDPVDMPSGKTAMVLDPDGHSIELQSLE